MIKISYIVIKKTSNKPAILITFLALGLLAPSVVLASVVINEVAWMGSTNSPNDEWIELYNPENYIISVEGWSIKSQSNSPTISLKGSIPAGGYFLLERTNDDSVPNIKANQIYSGALSNDGENLILTDNSGIIQDQVNSLRGWPAGDAKIKTTMERDSATSDSGWHNGPVGGTPRAKNSIASSVVTASPHLTKSITSSTIFHKSYNS